MTVVQNSYSERFAKGFPGAVAGGEASNRISRTVEDAAGIGFGRFAWRGAGDQGCTATPAAGACLGVVLADAGLQPLPGGAAADIVPQHGSAGIITKGAVQVIAGEAVTAGAQAYVTPAGAIVDSPTSNIIAPGWLFDESVGSGELVRIVNRG